MNNLLRYIIGIYVAIVLVGCSNDSMSAGSSILTETDKIYVNVDTFDLHSLIRPCDSIISWPDSFMVGEMENSYGTLHAAIMTQLACPEGFTYPQSPDTKVDSIEIGFSYLSYYGDGSAPLVFDVKRMDKKTFDYSTSYPSNIRIEDYVSENARSVLDHPKIVVASERVDSSLYSDGTYASVVRARLSDEFVQWFAQRSSYTTQEDFNEWFKGLYIYSDFGGSTILNVSDIALVVYYSFSYKKGDRDTIVHDAKEFFANSEVRQVNLIHYDNKDQVFQELQKDSDTYNYIIAPANIYTHLLVPMKAIQDSIVHRVGDKRPYVNMAKVRVLVDNVYDGESKQDRDDWSQPASYLLLIKESSFSRFFMYRELPSDTCAILATLSSTVTDDGETVYYYEYELASMLTNQLRHKEEEIKEMNMILVPVSVQLSSSSSSTVITAIKQQQTISATKILSATNSDNPMSLEVVYSGF